MEKARASATPLLSKCGPAWRPPRVPITTPATEATRLGHGLHDMMARYCLTGESDFALCKEIAALYAVPPAELLFLYRRACSIWHDVEHFFPEPAAELELSDGTDAVLLTGHVDLASYYEPDRVHILDWKTGRLEGDHDDQMKAYAWLACEHYDVSEAWACTVLVREGEIVSPLTEERPYWSRAELRRWFNRLEKTSAETEYAPGEHCSWCPHSVTCEGKAGYLSSTFQVLGDLASMGLAAPMIPESGPERARWMVELYGRVATAKRHLAMAEELLRATVKSEGPQQGDEWRLSLEPESRRSIDYGAALPVLEQYLPHEELARCVKLTKTALEGALRSVAEPRRGAALIRSVMEDLEAAQAVAVSEVWKLKHKKVRAD